MKRSQRCSNVLLPEIFQSTPERIAHALASDRHFSSHACCVPALLKRLYAVCLCLCPGLDSPTYPVKDMPTHTRAVKLRQQSLEDKLESCRLELRKLCIREAVSLITLLLIIERGSPVTRPAREYTASRAIRSLLLRILAWQSWRSWLETRRAALGFVLEIVGQGWVASL